MKSEELEEAAQAIRQRWGEQEVRAGMILGSGWGDLLNIFQIKRSLSYQELPGMGATGVSGHVGELHLAECIGIPLYIFQGRHHWYEGKGWGPIGIPVYLLKAAHASFVVLTNAAGGIRSDLNPGDLMLITDHIHMLPSHPLIGPSREKWGPAFPDQTEIYRNDLRKKLLLAADRSSVALRDGVYMAVSGPTYETPAEIRAYRTLGADAIGMSTTPEAILANAAGLGVLGLSCITNYAAGITPNPLGHDEVLRSTQRALPAMKNLFQCFWEGVAHES